MSFEEIRLLWVTTGSHLTFFVRLLVFLARTLKRQPRFVPRVQFVSPFAVNAVVVSCRHKVEWSALIESLIELLEKISVAGKIISHRTSVNSISFIGPARSVLVMSQQDRVFPHSCSAKDCICKKPSSSSSSSCARRRCMSPSQKRLFSAAPPGCHTACHSVVLVLATCPASKHHVVDIAAVDVLQS